MTTVYLDSSAIAKLTIEERESFAFVDYLAGGDLSISTSVIAEVEVGRALQRIQASRDEQDEAMRGMYLLAVDADIRREALRLKPPHLRSLDAIHLATALSIGDADLEFITYDDRQAEAARAAGLKVVQPGR